MKRLAICFALIALSTATLAQKKKGKSGTKAMLTHEDSLSYAFGLSVMENAKSAGFENLSDELIMQAILDSKAGKSKLDKDKATGIINAEVRKNSQKKTDMNKKRGEEYLVANGKKCNARQERQGYGALPWNYHRRGHFRQFGRSWKAGDFWFESGYSRLDRRTSIDERRLEVYVLHSAGIGLRLQSTRKD
jgi:hypothetical protein